MSYDTLVPAGAKALFDGDEDWIFVDVRTVEEFEGGHAPGSFNVPFAFRTPAGMELNPAFVGAMKRIFPSDARLVLG